MDNEPLAKVQTNKRGTYDILARYNERGKFKIIETLVDGAQANLFVTQLCNDDQLRHTAFRDAKGWDFVEDAPKVKYKRTPKPPKEPKEIVPDFSFLD